MDGGGAVETDGEGPGLCREEGNRSSTGPAQLQILSSLSLVRAAVVCVCGM